MARMIHFCTKQVYQGVTGATENWSEIFDVTDVERLDAELRVFNTTDTAAIVTGQIWTTSDPTFMDGSWLQVGAPGITQTSSGVNTGVFSGLGRFARAKLIVPAGKTVTACIHAAAREP